MNRLQAIFCFCFTFVLLFWFLDVLDLDDPFPDLLCLSEASGAAGSLVSRFAAEARLRAELRSRTLQWMVYEKSWKDICEILISILYFFLQADCC